jgi:flagellar protein FlaG
MITNLSQIISIPSSPVRELTPPPPPSVAVQPVAAANGDVSVNTGNTGATQANMTSGENAVASDQALADAVDRLNSKIQNLNRNLEFSINNDSGEVLVKVVDNKTHEVIRQIPSDEVLALARDIDRYMQDHHMRLVEAKV